MNTTTSHDKENFYRGGPTHHRGGLLYPNEKLGSIPETSTLSGKKNKGTAPPMKDKITSFELDSFLDGGKKQVAIIDPLQALNGRSRIARKLLVSPLQVVSSGNKRSFAMQAAEVGDTTRAKKKMLTSRNGLLSFEDETRLEFFCGKSKSPKTKLEIEREFDIFFENVNYVQCEDELKVFDSCPEVITKINTFLSKYRLIDRSLFGRHLRVHGNCFNAFLQSQNQEKCDNVTYRHAYIFFEKLRVYLGQPKSAARLFNEANYPNGFSLKKPTKKSLRKRLRSDHEFC